MGNANRYRRGKRQLVEVPVASATVIEKGDFVLLVSGKATTPSLHLADGSEVATATLVHDACADYFAGIAETASAAGETADILVDVSIDSIYELQQGTAEAISFGDLIAVLANSTASISFTGTDDSIDTVANGSTNPIAVCVKEHTAAQGTGTLCKLLPNKIMNPTTGQD